MSKLPDVVVIVMDCVRDSDFQPSEDGAYLPFARELARESVRFTRALAPASWTVPSHASLFSGRYPWEHGITTFSNLTPNPGFKTIAAHLRARGYSTVSVSANFLIGTELGIANDFDEAYWGGWWEPYFRYPLPSRSMLERFRGVPFDNVFLRSASIPPRVGMPGLLRKHSSQVLRHVQLLDIANRVNRFLDDHRHPPRVSPWVEPVLERWLVRQPEEKPLFAFLNLLDGHEPYLALDSLHGFAAWWDYAQLPQERWGWIHGETCLPAERMAPLHEIYRQMIAVLDRRVQRICDLFRSAGRWEDTVVVLTSDHGQSFGEHGRLFHARGVEEEVVHIPLWAKFPRGEHGGKVVDHWASLVDVVPTICDISRCPKPMDTSGYSLRYLAENSRPTPALSMSDGYGHRMLPRTSDGQSPPPAPFSMAACEGQWKVILDDLLGDPQKRAYDLASDPRELKDVWDEKNPVLVKLAKASLPAIPGILGHARIPPKMGVVDRLATWGYA